MSERIEKADLISQEALDAVQKLKDDISLLNKEFRQLLTESKRVNALMTGAKGLKQLNKETLEAAKLQNKLIIESKKYTTLMEKLELQTRKNAAAAEKFNNQQVKAKENTNTWGKALGSFQFKFNLLGNAVASLATGMAGLATMVAGKVLKSFASFFTKSEEGMDLLERKTAGFSASLAVLSGEFIKLGKSMTGSQEKAIKWGNIFEVIFRQLIGIGNLIPQVNNWFKDTKTRMNDAAIAAEKYTKAQQELEDEENRLITVRSSASRAIKEARLAFNESNGPISERIELLKTALNLEEDAIDQELLYARTALYNMLLIKIEREKVDQWLRSDERKIQELQANIDNLMAQSAGRRIRITKTVKNETEKLEKEQTEAIKKEAEERKKIKDAEFKEFIAQKDAMAAKGKEISEATMDFIGEQADEEIKAMQDKEDKLLEIQKDADEKSKDQTKKSEDEKKELRLSGLQAIQDSENALFDLKAAKLDAQMNKELAAAEGNEAKQEQIKKKYARKQQALDIKRAIVNGLLAVTKTFAEYGFTPAAWIANAALAVQTLATVGVMKAQKFAKGTKNSPEGVHWVGEKGTELMIDPAGNVGFSPSQASLAYLQKGTKIFPADVTRDMLGTMDYHSTSTRKKEQNNELIPYIQQLVNKPVTSVNIDNNGITVMTRSSQNVQKRIDKYFRT